MYKLKAVLAISLLISLLTGSVYFFSNGATVLPAEIIETEHSRVQDVLREKLLNAEKSLITQANHLAAEPKLIQELDLVRTKLMAATSEELRRNESNRWPEAVYNSLIDWKQKQDSAIKQHDSTRSEWMKAPESNMMAQRPLANWWKKSPDLLLAFAAVPMKDGVVSSLLIAHGVSTKKLNPAAGKRYDEAYPVLAEVTQSQQAKFGHFVWDQKMYMAVVAPVTKDGNLIGLVVSGVELSASMNDAFSRSLPSYVNLMLTYSSPKFGEEPTNNRPVNRIIYTNSSEDIRDSLESGRFHVMANEMNTDNWMSYDKVAANSVYATSSDVERPMAVSRIRWTWNETEETDLYVVTNLKAANKSRDILQMKILIAGLIALALGAILAVVFVNMMQRNTLRIRKGIAEAISSGEPIAPETLALLTGEDPDELGLYTIQPVKEATEDAPEDWSNLMMDFDDDSNHKADAATTPEEAAKLKNAADAEEAKPLYEEYMRLRKENNIDTPMDFDCFLRRLQRNAAKIKATYKCDNVTFQVHVSDGNVVLKPKIDKKKSA